MLSIGVAATLAFVGGPIGSRLAMASTASGSLPLAVPIISAPSPAALLHETSRRLMESAVALRLQAVLPATGVPADDVMLALVSPEAFWLLREWRMQAFGAQESMKTVLESTQQQIHTMLGPRATVAVRSKGLWSTFHKATVRQKQVHDVLAVRVVVRGSEEADVYDALDAIRQTYPSVGEARYKDYVARPKANGYQGLHDTLRLPNGQLFEIQVRNERMHAHAMWGSASHRRYKQGPVWLSHQMLSGMASGLGAASKEGVVQPLRWPLQPHTALRLATHAVPSY